MEKGFSSLKSLSNWLTELKDRTQFFREWVNKGIPNVLQLNGKNTLKLYFKVKLFLLLFL